MYEVTMPKLSDSMEQGKIIAWKVKEGDEVRAGDVLAEVESDKAVMELECFRDGVVAGITHGDGEEVAVGEVIARIREAGEGAPAPPAAPAEPAPTATPQHASTAHLAAEFTRRSSPAEPTPAASPTPVVRPTGQRIAISPYARKLAHEKGVDYTKVKGTGPGGRIVARDIEQAARPAAAQKPTTPAATAPAAPPAAAPPEPAADELPPLEVAPGEADIAPASFRLKTQARRVAAAKRFIPHFYLTRTVEVTRLIDRQRELKENTGATLTHLVMLACLKALKAHPEVNRSYDRGRVVAWKGVHLGLAVDTEEGLTVAVLRDAQDLALAAIVARTGPLVERARLGRLSADERRHATFTVTNLGMFGVDEFQPIINPPSAVTLGVASAREATVVRDGAIRIGRLMNLTAACDHRICDGATAARFMADLAALLEDPDRLLGTA